MKIASFVDSKGHVFVDCSECDRGGNGTDPEKCSCGWRVKKEKHGGCYIGNLMPQYWEEISRKLKVDVCVKSA